MQVICFQIKNIYFLPAGLFPQIPSTIQPMQLVFTGGCFASSKTAFFLLLQVIAKQMYIKNISDMK